jgi:hypothetical protein
MRVMTRLSTCAWAALLALQALPVQAAPITVHLEKRLTFVSDIPTHLGSFIPDDTLVSLDITYDPETLVVLYEGYGAEIHTTGPVSYEISLPALEDPWGGPVEHVGAAWVQFYEEGERGLVVDIQDRYVIPGCTPDGKCNRRWFTGLLLGIPAYGPPVVSPTAADFNEMFRHLGEPNSGFNFSTSACYNPPDGSSGTCLPGSRIYAAVTYEAPEPQLNLLLAAGFTALGLLRRWRAGR